jgi:hypothetical protein
MQTLTQQRCLHHPVREAVARCPECGGFFCRECVTEHDDRVICANCLKAITRDSTRSRLRLGALRRIAFCGLGMLVAWICFYEIGRTLLLIPTSFHDGTVWQSSDQ